MRYWPEIHRLRHFYAPVAALYSTMGRTAARTLETGIIAAAMPGWYDQLVANIRTNDLKTFNETSWEPSSWPKPAKGVGFTEALRTIHGFDPCIVCAVHVLDPAGGEPVKVKVL